MTESATTRKVFIAFATALGGYALLGSFASFLGWPLDTPRLTDWFNDGVSIQPNACLLIMLSGTGVILAQCRAWRAVTTLGALVGVGGVLILLQYIIGADFGFNHQLLFGRTWGQSTTLTPGRVGPPASTAFIFTGIALLCLGSTRLQPCRAHRRSLVPMLGVAVCVIMAFSLLGYLFGAEQFYTIPWLTAIALPTASMLLAVGIGLILSVPEHDPILLLREHSGAGALARIAIPALILMIPLVLWLRIRGNEEGYFDLGTGRALGALTLLVGSIGFLWIALAALRRHERALRDADRRKDEFLATLAHELRNPLAPVMNSLGILERTGSDEAAVTEARATIFRQMRHMVRLIDDLLDMSRISRGTFELRKERVELQPVVHQTIKSIGAASEAAPHKFKLELPMEPVWIEADPVRLAQIFVNLLSNASRYSDTGAEITIRASLAEGSVVVSVKDNGIGMPPDKLESIFEMFSQLDRSLERTTGGLGIGLYLVKRLVEMHGGTVTAHSEGPGTGSEFVVRLPVVAAPGVVEPTAPPEPDVATPPVGRRRVLVVDDQRDAAKTMAMLLGAHGYETETAHDGLQAMEAAEAFNPDVILLDIGLPRLNGYEACRQIRQQPWGSEMVILALTGWGKEEDKRRAEESGFDAHLVKPVEPSKLLELMASLLNEHDPSCGSVALTPTASSRPE